MLNKSLFKFNKIPMASDVFRKTVEGLFCSNDKSNQYKSAGLSTK